MIADQARTNQLLAVLSDTHGQVAFTQQAARALESWPVAALVHCGDIGSIAVARALLQWPGHYVFGNCDYDRAELRKELLALGQTCHGEFGSLELAGRRIAFLHGDDQARLDRTIAEGTWDLVCHGHTHRQRHERRGRTLVLNPGALYRAQPHSLAVVELPALEVHFLTL